MYQQFPRGTRGFHANEIETKGLTSVASTAQARRLAAVWFRRQATGLGGPRRNAKRVAGEARPKRFGDTAMQLLLCALVVVRLLPRGFSNRELRTA